MARERCPLTASLYIACMAGLAWLMLATAAPAQGLRVGVAGSAPFVIRDRTRLAGIVVEVWQEVAQDEGLNYELVPQKNVRTGLAAVANRELDLLIGPISITADRVADNRIRFTQPFFVASIGVLLPPKEASLWERLTPFFGFAAFSSIISLIAALFIVGNLLWLAERKQNPEHFPPEYLRGVGNGMWVAMVTFSTVGYGDLYPITRLGRIVAGSWMIVTIITVSTITAGLASAFTTALSSQEGGTRFEQPADLRGARMAVVNGTTSVSWGQYYQAKLTPAENLETAVQLVEAGQVDGLIFDRPALEYYLHKHPESKLRLAAFTVATEFYGVAMPRGSPLESLLNVALLKVLQDKRTLEIADRWLKG